MRLTLKDVGYPHMQKIMQGRKWVGRVVRCDGEKAGQFYGRIGKNEAYGSSFEDAFRKVGSLAMGYSSPEALSQHNAAVRDTQRAQQERIRPAKEALQRGDFRTFFSELDKAIARDNERMKK